jgi:hypothetical protein
LRAPILERAVKSRAKQTIRPGRRSLIVNPYEVLIQGVVDYAIYMLDLDGRVMSWNPGAERIKAMDTTRWKAGGGERMAAAFGPALWWMRSTMMAG